MTPIDYVLLGLFVAFNAWNIGGIWRAHREMSAWRAYAKMLGRR